MCGRYTQLHSWEELVELYRLTDTGFRPNLPPRLDIRPTTDVPIVRLNEDGDREGAMARWWLIPSWANELSQKFATFNARDDKLADNRVFKGPLKSKRCLIPASGFYEWHGKAKPKDRFYITTKSGAPITFAGLWERNTNLGVDSCTIITTKPNGVLKPLHNRMPAILAEDDWQTWLAEPKTELLKPAPDDDLVADKVRRLIKDDGVLDQLDPIET